MTPMLTLTNITYYLPPWYEKYTALGSSKSNLQLWQKMDMMKIYINTNTLAQISLFGVYLKIFYLKTLILIYNQNQNRPWNWLKVQTKQRISKFLDPYSELKRVLSNFFIMTFFSKLIQNICPKHTYHIGYDIITTMSYCNDT